MAIFGMIYRLIAEMHLVSQLRDVFFLTRWYICIDLASCIQQQVAQDVLANKTIRMVKRKLGQLQMRQSFVENTAR